jgi:predicted GIY-YIG superfamily endonuclease
MAFLEPQPDRASAMRRELELKAMPRARKRALIDTQASRELEARGKPSTKDEVAS